MGNTRAVRSSLPVTTHRPSGLNPTDHTAPSWASQLTGRAATARA